MIYQNKALCRVRTITTFLSLTHDKSQWQSEISKASTFCLDLAQVLQQQNYEVQSIRIVTNPFGEYLNTTSLENAKADLTYLSDMLNSFDSTGLRIRFAIGEAKTVAEIKLLPALIQQFGDLCNVCVNVPIDENDILDNALIEHCAQTVLDVSKVTPRGEGNFNFTVNFNCQPLIPYFPASYHDKALGNRFVIGLETPDLLVEVLAESNREFNKKCNQECNEQSALNNLYHNEKMAVYFEKMSQALQFHIDNIQRLAEPFSSTEDFVFSGFDSSAAPSKSCASMVEVYKQLGVEYFGASGTVEASSLLTKVFKSIKNANLIGFSGLMLALTEDEGLAQGSINNEFDIRSLLTYSAVCGIGLDTVPIPGDTSLEKISALMRDTGTMAFRLNKPLTVRVFPVPMLKAGDLTAFESDDLCNCAVLAVP